LIKVDIWRNLAIYQINALPSQPIATATIPTPTDSVSATTDTGPTTLHSALLHRVG